MSFLSFKLPDHVVKSYQDRQVNWGFQIGAGNSLSELTFLTRYSRIKSASTGYPDFNAEDGMKERWFETCRRVVEGMFSIQKDWCKTHQTPWNEQKAQATAKDAYERMWSFKWSPPGRGMWAMGTQMVNERWDGSPLQNCAFLSTAQLSSRSHRDATLPFVRMMEMSMRGIGVGFDTLGAGNMTFHAPTNETETFVVPDTREGWAESFGVQLVSFLFPNKPTVVFDYSLIRDAGLPLKTFGGKAAGPEPLRRLNEMTAQLLRGREGTTITSTDIVDLMNLSGKAVVAGGTRRSAQLALGLSSDEAFLDLKNWEKNPERTAPDGWAHLSNNSISASVGEDYDNIVDRIASNGEPGLVYLDLMRSHGRMADPASNRDYRVAGVNPCGEQPLEHSECCTLVEMYLPHHESLEDAIRTAKFAYMYGKTVTLLPTPWPETNEVMARNRRIGLSLSGQAQFVEARGWHEMKRWMDTLYHAVVARDVQYSEWLGVRESIKRTTVKPSGTTGLLAGVTPGAHWPVADIYTRRMRFSVTEEIVGVLREAGYRTEPDIMDPTFSVVVELPTIGPRIRTEREVTVWEKVALAAMAQRYWSDNAVSVTATFLPHEKDQLGPLLRAFDGQLKSLSMLPLFENGDAYQQAPYSRISEEDYERAISRVKPLKWNRLYDGGGLDAEDEKFCTNDHCVVV